MFFNDDICGWLVSSESELTSSRTKNAKTITHKGKDYIQIEKNDGSYFRILSDEYYNENRRIEKAVPHAV